MNHDFGPFLNGTSEQEHLWPRWTKAIRLRRILRNEGKGSNPLGCKNNNNYNSINIICYQ